MLMDHFKPRPWDARRHLAIPGDAQATLTFSLHHFIALCQAAIAKHGAFYVALSGGSTPKTLFEHLSHPPYNNQIEWAKVHLFWSDERSVSLDHPDSNYHMAMEAGLKNMPIPAEQIHPMRADKEIEKSAMDYEQTIRRVLGNRPFDLIMLGMGDDGHTASLFPHTEALHAQGKLVIANYVPQKNTWRMTMTYECINSAEQCAIYVIGASKKQMLAKVLRSPDQFEDLPVQKVGTAAHPALWIADDAAASELISRK